jgi:hypothetical protein
MAQMKAYYLADLPQDELPEEFRLPMSSEEREFRSRFWEAQSRMIQTDSSTAFIETEYGVTGIWDMSGEPIKLTFTRKSFDEDEFVTTDIEEIFGKILSCKEISERVQEMLRLELGDMEFGGLPACLEVFYLILHPRFDVKELGNILLEFVEEQALSKGISYLVANEENDDQERRELLSSRGFIEIHQPKFMYKHAGKMETYWQIKKLD